MLIRRIDAIMIAIIITASMFIKRRVMSKNMDDTKDICDRREKGSGSFRTKENGSVEFRVTIDGVSKSFSGKDKSEARRKFREYQKNNRKWDYSPSKTTVEDYVENWLTLYKFKKVSDSTYDRTEDTFHRHIKGSTVGKMKISKVESDDIQRMIDEKSESYSMSEVKKIYEILNPCFRHATIKGDLLFNCMQLVSMPLEKNFKVKTKEIEIYSDDDVSVIAEFVLSDIEYLKDKRLLRYAPIYLFLLLTGLRLGEVCALEWKDIDFKNRTATINKGMTYVKNRGRFDTDVKKVEVVSTTKTKSGVRKIPLNSLAVECLNILMSRDTELGIDSDYVIHNQSGDHISMSTVQKRFIKICKEVGVNHHGIHSLRHTFASQLIRQGKDIKTVSKLLGHSKIQITLDRYVHIIFEQEMEAVGSLESLYQNTQNSGIVVGLNDYKSGKAHKYGV